MEVLSALLGLDLYNRMAEITAAESKEQRRTIASAKDMLTVYTDEIAHKEELQSAQDAAKAKIAEAEQQIASADKLIAAAKAKQAAYDTIMQQIAVRDENGDRVSDITIRKIRKILQGKGNPAGNITGRKRLQGDLWRPCSLYGQT